jgi:imidazole glycerol-phosphate synthase subunit HisH
MVTVIDYGLGNLFSVARALEMVGAEVVISSKPSDVHSAERLVLPGVGAFGDGMKFLREKKLDTALTEAVIKHQKPFLGICLGLQLLAEEGEEHGKHEGLGWIRGKVRKLSVEAHHLKVPHIGWNNVDIVRPHPLFEGVQGDADFYFVHSYQLECGAAESLIATAQYGESITAVIGHKNIFAAQFHPEKSQDNGLKLLENFLHWHP